jgi:hypothetical protein
VTVTQMRSQAPVDLPKAPAVDLNLEVVVIPVSDVDRAKNFYAGLALQLPTCFEMRTLSGGLVSSAPE